MSPAPNVQQERTRPVVVLSQWRTVWLVLQARTQSLLEPAGKEHAQSAKATRMKHLLGLQHLDLSLMHLSYPQIRSKFLLRGSKRDLSQEYNMEKGALAVEALNCWPQQGTFGMLLLKLESYHRCQSQHFSPRHFWLYPDPQNVKRALVIWQATGFAAKATLLCLGSVLLPRVRACAFLACQLQMKQYTLACSFKYQWPRRTPITRQSRQTLFPSSSCRSPSPQAGSELILLLLCWVRHCSGCRRVEPAW
mmetsp:Transcript_28714/g.60111  ORF Transcript_28714/g.60111 Transcript_28714/m.60111 type:complete len:250 (-) Transcript_28714:159-908(-)